MPDAVGKHTGLLERPCAGHGDSRAALLGLGKGVPFRDPLKGLVFLFSGLGSRVSGWGFRV